MTHSSNPPLRLDDGGSRALGRWPAALACLAAALAGLVALFWETAASAAQVWADSATFNHCFLILPISLYLVRQRRDGLADLAPRPSWLGLLVIAAAGGLWLTGELASFNEARQFALVVMIQGVVLAVLGAAVYRALLFPLLYLFFLVPTGEFLVGPLQDVTAGFVIVGLELVGVPVFRDGVFIQIPNGTFQVAEACAGLRFLIASLAFGVLFANQVYRSPDRRAAFIAAALVVPIAANGARAFGIVMIAHLSDNKLAVGVDHIVYGWGFFAAVTLLLIWIGLRFQQEPAAPRIAAVSEAAGAPALAAAAALALALAWMPQAYAAHLSSVIPVADLDALEPPPAPSLWRAIDGRDTWRPLLHGVDREAVATYGRGGERVVAYVGYFTHQGAGKKLIGSENRMADEKPWRRMGGGTAEASVDGQLVPVRSERLTDGKATRLLWYWYWIDGRFTASAATAKLLQVKAELLGGTRGAAVIAIATDYRDTPEEAEARLAAFAAAMPPLAPRLARVASPGKE